MTQDTIPAAGPGLPKITRRAALAGLAAATFSTTSPTTAATSDAGIGPLAGQYLALHDAIDAVARKRKDLGKADPILDRTFDELFDIREAVEAELLDFPIATSEDLRALARCALRAADGLDPTEGNGPDVEMAWRLVHLLAGRA